MAAKVCWQTETRAMRLALDARYIRDFLTTFTPKTAREVAEWLTVNECAALSLHRQAAIFQEFSIVWNESPPMAPPPGYAALRGDWKAD